MKKFIQKRFKNERGLTLVELLAVVVILGIIAVISFVFVGGIIENSKKDAHIANAQQIIAAAKLHDATTQDFESITVRNNEGNDGLIEKQYLDKVIDPWTKEEYDSLEDVKVTKDKEDDGKTEFKIENFNAKSCEITKTETELNTEDRDQICDNE